MTYRPVDKVILLAPPILRLGRTDGGGVPLCRYSDGRMRLVYIGSLDGTEILTSPRRCPSTELAQQKCAAAKRCVQQMSKAMYKNASVTVPPSNVLETKIAHPVGVRAGRFLRERWRPCLGLGVRSYLHNEPSRSLRLHSYLFVCSI